MRVLALDPSLQSFGFAVVDTATPRLIASGTIRTKPKHAHLQRLTTLRDGIAAAARKHGPFDAIACEGGFSNAKHSGTTTQVQAEARAVCLLVAWEIAGHPPVTILAPASVKKAVAGHGRADKEAMIAAVERVLGVRLPSDEADACAVGLCAGDYRAATDARVRAKGGTK